MEILIWSILQIGSIIAYLRIFTCYQVEYVTELGFHKRSQKGNTEYRYPQSSREIQKQLTLMPINLVLKLASVLISISILGYSKIKWSGCLVIC